MHARNVLIKFARFVIAWNLALIVLLMLAAVVWGQKKRVPSSTERSPGEFVRSTGPQTLQFADLVELSQHEPPNETVDSKLSKLLTTPFISNEAYLARAKPKRPSSQALGPFIRAVLWNIERGVQFESIRTALVQPDKFDQVIVQKKDSKQEPLTKEEQAEVEKQLEMLKYTDLFVINEADKGVTRTDYRDVTRELAQALKMNYAYGVEFVEVDPLSLGLEKVKMEDKAAESDIQKSFEPDKQKYLGLHGTAVLSRYPIRSATLHRLPSCYDWYLGEKKEISKVESGVRAASNLVFMERIAREVRRGGRMALIVQLAVPESPTGTLTVVATHLENKCKPECRRKQMAQILQWIRADPNPLVLAGDMNTTGSDSSPTSARKILNERLKDPDAWVKDAVKWSTGAPTALLMPLNMFRNKNDPTGFDVPVVSRKKEGKMFGDLEDFRFNDGHTFDFRGEDLRSANNRGGTLSDSNERVSKGFQYTFAMAKTYGGLVGQYKLDWLFVKGYATDPEKPGGSYKFAPHFAWTLEELNNAPDKPLSDHFPLTVDLPLREPSLK
jgi:endonuclease/exonuclease/phosphatase family metal-dependent hydrolase